MAFSDIGELYEWLLPFGHLGRDIDLAPYRVERMAALCGAFGHPEKDFASVHVAGSKGKGSVARMVAGGLAEAGIACGLYTSPHVLCWDERIASGSGQLPEALLLGAGNALRPWVEALDPAFLPFSPKPTYFELTTLIAFMAFREAGFAAAAIECGLGGSFDATNVVEGASAVVTSVELEHMDHLGSTIEEIASHKAGILKPGRPCFAGTLPGAALAVLDARAGKIGTRLVALGRDAMMEGITIDVEGSRAELAIGNERIALATVLPGRSFLVDAALAFLSARAAFPKADPGLLLKGIAKAKLPARFQILSRSPPIVLDGAHTPESVRALAECFASLFPSPRRLLFACAAGKRSAEMAALLGPLFERITVTKPGDFKESDPPSVEADFRRLGFPTELATEPEEAYERAKAAAARDGASLLICGSFYLAERVLRSEARLSAKPVL